MGTVTADSGKKCVWKNRACLEEQSEFGILRMGSNIQRED
jgi:hypothetical protein